MKLPWAKKAEHRGYTEMMIEAALAAASGETVSGLVASLEIITGWWGRGFQSADIQPAGVVADLLRPHLAVIGRSLVTRGEMVFAIDTDGDSLALLPASDHHIEGSPNPESWQYTLTLTGPTETITRTLAADRVLHLQYAADPPTSLPQRLPYRRVGNHQRANVDAGNPTHGGNQWRRGNCHSPAQRKRGCYPSGTIAQPERQTGTGRIHKSSMGRGQPGRPNRRLRTAAAWRRTTGTNRSAKAASGAILTGVGWCSRDRTGLRRRNGKP